MLNAMMENKRKQNIFWYFDIFSEIMIAEHYICEHDQNIKILRNLQMKLTNEKDLSASMLPTRRTTTVFWKVLEFESQPVSLLTNTQLFSQIVKNECPVLWVLIYMVH